MLVARSKHLEVVSTL